MLSCDVLTDADELLTCDMLTHAPCTAGVAPSMMASTDCTVGLDSLTSTGAIGGQYFVPVCVSDHIRRAAA